MANITFEQFLQHTNAEEIIVQKMKEAGPRIYRLNYDRRLKHCKVLYKKFYDVKLRDTVLTYGLVLKPMPKCFQGKFLQFPQKNNNEGENNNSDTTESKSEQKRKNKSPTLEDNYKDDLPSTSTAFVHKPRLISPHEKNKTQRKTKLKPNSRQQLNLKRDISSTKTNKIPTKSQKFPKADHKITSYFTSNAMHMNVDEQPNTEGIMKLRKRISDSTNENIENLPRSKRPKISPVKKIGTKKEPENIKSKIDTMSSKTNSKDKIKKRNKCDRKKTSINKSGTERRTRLYSDDIVSDNCEINSNNSVVNLTSEDSREHIQSSPNRNFENNSSPSKSALPKRNRTEDFGKISNEISKKLLKEISPEKGKKHKNGFTKNEIKLWIMEGQKALEDNKENNKSACTGRRPVRQDVSVGSKLQTIKSNPDKVKNHIKYWLKFEIQMRKGINLEATVVSDTSRAKILSAFNQMTYEDFKNLINVQSYISHWTSLGVSIEDLEQKFKNHYTTFMERENSWPAFHIELAKLQSFLHSKGTKGPIPLKNIPPRLLSFDEVLKKTNIKEFISLNCNKPPESYKELLSLCKKKYEKCCCEGVWTEELKLNDIREESESSQEMSIELFTEPSMPMSPLKISLDSGKSEQHVVQKELTALQNLDNSSSSYNVTSELQSSEQNEFGEHSKHSTKVFISKDRKSRKFGPKCRRKHSSKSDDDLEVRIHHICGDEEQPSLRNTIEPPPPINTQELNRILAHSQPPGMDHPVTMSPNILACSDETNTKFSSIQMNTETSKTPPNVGSKEIPFTSSEMDGFMSTSNDKSTDKNDRSSEKDNLIPPSPNLFQSSGESYSKCVGSHLIGVQTQESVYVACEVNNDFQTEQNNFSIIMNEATESEDPFGETIANQEETFAIRLDPNPSCEPGNNGKTNKNTQIPNYELNIPEELKLVAVNLDTNQINDKIMQDTVDSEETIISKQPPLSCKENSLESLETSDNRKTHFTERNVSENLTSFADNADPNEMGGKTTKNTIDSEETIEKLSSNLSHETSDVVDIMNTNLEPRTYHNTDAVSCENAKNKENKSSLTSATKNTIDSEETIEKPSSNLSHETSDVVHSMNTSLEPGTYHNTDAVSCENANNMENKSSVTSVQSIGPTPDTNDVAEKAKKKTTENLQSLQPERNVSKNNSVCFLKPADVQKDLNTDRNQTASKLTLDYNTLPNKNTVKSVENLETDLNASISEESIRNVRVIVKREMFSQPFSQYDDDVEIIEIPQSDAMVIDDEETAPELLEALLCSSAHNNRSPMTIIHASVSPVMSSSIYLDNIPQAQQLPSNFDLTQSQLNLNQSSNVSTNASSGKVVETTHNIAANLSCSANVVLKKSPSSHQVTESKVRKKSSDRKQKLVTNKPSCSSKSKDDRQLSEEMSEMSYVSIAPQNIPSEIELTQTSLNKLTNEKQKNRLDTEENSKSTEKTKKVSINLRAIKQNTSSEDKAKESGGSILHGVNDRSSGTNLDLTQNINEYIKSEEFLSCNKIPHLSTPKQSREMETFEPSKENSGIDEKDVGFKNVEQRPVASLTKDSLDRSRDVGLPQESIENDIGVSANISIAKNKKKHNKISSQYLSSFDKDIAQEQFENSGNNDFIKDTDTSHNSGVIDVKVSKDKVLSIESKNYHEEASEYTETSLCQSKEDLNNIELLKDTNADNTAENAESSLEVVFSVSDSDDVELVEESEEEDDITGDNTATKDINNLSKCITENEAQNTELGNIFRLSEEGTVRDEETVDDGFYSKQTAQANGPIYHVLVSDINTFQTFNCNEADGKTYGEDKLDDSEHINKIVKPIKTCKVRIPKVNLIEAVEQNHNKRNPSTVQEMQTNIKGPPEAVLLKTKEDCHTSKVVTYPEGINSIIQSPTEVKCIEQESVFEKLSSRDVVANKKLISKHQNIDINLQCKDQMIKESNALQEQNLTNSINSKTIKASEPIKIAVETCKNLGVRVRKNIAMTSSTTVRTPHLGMSTVVADNVNSDVENNDFQLTSEKSTTKQILESTECKNQLHPNLKQVLDTLTVKHFRNSETTEDLSTRSSVSERLETNVPEVSKSIVETTLPRKTSQFHSISEKQKDTIDEDIFPTSSESFSGLSETANKLTTENVDQVPKTCDKIFPSPSLVINKAENTSEYETYSEFFGKNDKTNAIAITTSTQVELPVSDEKENEEENHIAAETSYGSSVELIDFSFYYISSDDGNSKDNFDQNESTKEEKFSHTLNFAEAPIFKNNIADSSKAVNYSINEESLQKLNEGSEFVLPVNIHSTFQNRAMGVPKDSEDFIITSDSKINYNSNKAESSESKSLSVSCTNPDVNLNLNKSCHSIISIDSKTSISNENLSNIVLKLRNAEATLCENTNSTAVELVKLIDKREFETTRIFLNEREKASLPENSQNQENIDTNQNFLRINHCFFSNQSSNIKKPEEEVMKINKNINKNIRRRTIFEQKESITDPLVRLSFSQPSVSPVCEVSHESFKSQPQLLQHEKEQTLNDSRTPFNFSPHSEVQHPEVPQTSPKSVSQRLSQKSSQEIIESTNNNFEPTKTMKLKTITLQGFIPFATLQNIQSSNEDFIQVPLMIEKRLLDVVLPISAISESNAVKVNVGLKIEQQDPNPFSLIPCDEKETIRVEKAVTTQENSEHSNPSKKLQIRSKKKTPSKKSSKLPDFVQQKTHAFSSIPLKPCNKPHKSKPPSLLTVEECDYLIEDASQPIASTTTSQILGTDCTYFENSELLRNLDGICISHHPEVPELQIEQLPPQVLSPPPTASKVINLTPITLSEGVTARKVWQVNLKWKSQKAMSIEVRFSVNRRTMTVCDESAKLLFTFTSEIWSDVHRVLREIDHFEYKRRTLKNQRKSTSLHKVLRKLFDSATQVVDVKLINDSYNPFTICEKTIPVYRKPFQCLTKGIAPEILGKMRFLKENLQNNNFEVNCTYPGRI